jgi:hypothetical protein
MSHAIVFGYSHPFDGGCEHIFPLDLSSLRHGDYVETHHGETYHGVALIDEISLHHASHDETPHDETFPDAIHRLETPHDETYRGALHYGSSGGFLGLCSCYLVDKD